MQDFWTINGMFVAARVIHRIILVLVKGGRDYITPQKAIYTWYIGGIYCQLGDYIIYYLPPFTRTRIILWVIIQFLFILPGPLQDEFWSRSRLRWRKTLRTLRGTNAPWDWNLEKTQKQTIIKGMQCETFGSAFFLSSLLLFCFKRGG